VSIGLLWDSVSPNMGDQAIGLVLQAMLQEHGIPWEVVDPFSQAPVETHALLIGGGELIRAPGHPFYDAFRVPGRHLLNAVGVLDGSQTDYLKDYRLVTARTEADRQRLGTGSVSPCPTVLLGTILSPSTPSPEIPGGAIGLHLSYPLHAEAVKLIPFLRQKASRPIVLLPLTHYNEDFYLLDVLGKSLPGSTRLERLLPAEAFRIIGKLSALVTTSLHAMLFAYVQGIPFLAYRGFGKIADFLADRDLLAMSFLTADDICGTLPDLLRSAPQLSAQVGADQRAAQLAADRIEAACRHALQGEARPVVLPATNRRLYAQEMEAHSYLGRQAAALVEHYLRPARADSGLEGRLRRWIRSVTRGPE
jgi:hypothetical protein